MHSDKTAILVLGMARSGTSALTGMLGLLGSGLPGDRVPASDLNPKGFFESPRIIILNNDILVETQSSEVDWDPLPKDWHRSAQAQPYISRATTLFQEVYGDAPLIVIKDPRLCRIVPFIETVLQKLGRQIRIVIPFRSPLEVADSETVHHRIPVTHGYLLWLRYVLDSEYFTRHQTRVFTHYEDLLNDWQAVAAKIENGLGLTFSEKHHAAEKISAFIDPALRRHRAIAHDAEQWAIPWIMPVYQALLALNQDANNASAMADLDRIRQEFDQACRAFSPLLRASCTGRQTNYMLAQTNHELVNRLRSVSGELQALHESKSWRITAPLRTLYARALGFAARKTR